MIRVEIERCSIKSIDKFEIMRKLLLTLYYLFVVCLGTSAQEPCPCVIPALQQWKEEMENCSCLLKEVSL